MDLVVFGVVADHAAAEGGVSAGVSGAALDPETQHLLLLRGGFDAVMRSVQQGQEAAGGGAERAWGVVAFGLVATVGDQARDGQHVITLAVQRPVVTGEDEPPGAWATGSGLLVAVTAYAERVEYWLDVTREVNHLGHAGNGLDPARRTTHCREWHGRGPGCLGALLVAADATGRFAGLHGQKALHALDGQVVLVQRYEEEATQRRQFEVSRAVFLHRHNADDALQREGAAVADWLHAAGVVDGHRQRFEHEELLDLAALHARSEERRVGKECRS